MLRPQITNAARAVGRRANSTQATNPQVQKAVQQASQIYAQGAQTVKRVAGPVGDRVGSLLGGEYDLGGPRPQRASSGSSRASATSQSAIGIDPARRSGRLDDDAYPHAVVPAACLPSRATLHVMPVMTGDAGVSAGRWNGDEDGAGYCR